MESDPLDPENVLNKSFDARLATEDEIAKLEENLGDMELDHINDIAEKDFQIAKLAEERDALSLMHHPKIREMKEAIMKKEKELMAHQKDLLKIMEKFEPDLSSNQAFCDKSRHRHFEIHDDGTGIKYKADSTSSVLGKKVLRKKGINKFTFQIGEHHNKITVGVAT